MEGDMSDSRTSVYDDRQDHAPGSISSYVLLKNAHELGYKEHSVIDESSTPGSAELRQLVPFRYQAGHGMQTGQGRTVPQTSRHIRSKVQLNAPHRPSPWEDPAAVEMIARFERVNRSQPMVYALQDTELPAAAAARLQEEVEAANSPVSKDIFLYDIVVKQHPHLRDALRGLQLLPRSDKTIIYKTLRSEFFPFDEDDMSAEHGDWSWNFWELLDDVFSDHVRADVEMNDVDDPRLRFTGLQPR